MPNTRDISSQTDISYKTNKRKIGFIESLLMPSSKRSKPTKTAKKQNAEIEDEAAAASMSNDNESSTSQADSTPTVRKQKSWYVSTWPTLYKSAPSTQLARESILAAKPTNGPSADLSKIDAKKAESATPMTPRPPSMYLGKSKETSGLSTFDGTEDMADGAKRMGDNSSKKPDNVPGDTLDSKNSDLSIKVDEVEKSSASESSTSAGLLSYIPIVNRWTTQPLPSPVDQPLSAGLGGREAVPDVKKQNETANSPNPKEELSNGSEESSGYLSSWLWSSKSAQAVPTETPTSDAQTALIKGPSTTATEELSADTSTGSDSNEPGGSSTRSWLRVFPLPSMSSGQSTPNTPNKDAQPSPRTADKVDKAPEVSEESDVPTFKDGSQPAPGSSWAYFGKTKGSETGSQNESGELAIYGDRTQYKPEPATIRRSSKGSKPTTPLSANALPTPDPIFRLGSLSKSQSHLLLPELRETYKLAENPSIMQQIARWVRLSREPPTQVVSLVKDPPRIKSAVAIGVHGLCLDPKLQMVIGAMTGTSKLFHNHASAAIRRWTKSQGYVCEIAPIELHYEGRVMDRVKQLWPLLLNYTAQIRSADLVMFACHSQGVPVTIMLVAKLVELGILMDHTKIGICAMAGVNLGPFLQYQSLTAKTFLNGVVGYELFDFAESDSALSQLYIESLRKALQYGVKITFIGSLDDQLVSMESSTFTPVHHPHIYRAVFVDGRHHSHDFIVRLVGFALKLRNLGIKDHGLIRELSNALAGPLLSGQGHSVIYDHVKVYELAVQHTMETKSIQNVDLQVHPYNTGLKPDPYFLPFALRGVLDEELVKTELSNEALELIQQFDEWQPQKKELIDVKNRLRVIKSVL